MPRIWILKYFAHNLHAFCAIISKTDHIWLLTYCTNIIPFQHKYESSRTLFVLVNWFIFYNTLILYIELITHIFTVTVGVCVCVCKYMNYLEHKNTGFLKRMFYTESPQICCCCHFCSKNELIFIWCEIVHSITFRLCYGFVIAWDDVLFYD